MSHPHDNKRELRQEKKTIKRRGNKKVRKTAKTILETDPEAILDLETHYGKLNSQELNGIDGIPNEEGRQDQE